jgi:hypothetical protein
MFCWECTLVFVGCMTVNDWIGVGVATKLAPWDLFVSLFLLMIFAKNARSYLGAGVSGTVGSDFSFFLVFFFDFFVECIQTLYLPMGASSKLNGVVSAH